jgi:hypothetical protein
LAHRRVPYNFGLAEAFADRVENVEDFVLQFVALQPFAHHVGAIDVNLGVTRRFDRDLQLGD